MIKDHIKTDHGEKYERIQDLEPYKDISWGALQDTMFAWKDPTDNIQTLTMRKDSENNIRGLAEFYQTNSKLPDTILLRYLGSDKISILGHLANEEDTAHGRRFSYIDKMEKPENKHE